MPSTSVYRIKKTIELIRQIYSHSYFHRRQQERRPEAIHSNKVAIPQALLGPPFQARTYLPSADGHFHKHCPGLLSHFAFRGGFALRRYTNADNYRQDLHSNRQLHRNRDPESPFSLLSHLFLIQRTCMSKVYEPTECWSFKENEQETIERGKIYVSSLPLVCGQSVQSILSLSIQIRVLLKFTMCIQALSLTASTTRHPPWLRNIFVPYRVIGSEFTIKYFDQLSVFNR